MKIWQKLKWFLRFRTKTVSLLDAANFNIKTIEVKNEELKDPIFMAKVWNLMHEALEHLAIANYPTYDDYLADIKKYWENPKNKKMPIRKSKLDIKFLYKIIWENYDIESIIKK